MEVSAPPLALPNSMPAPPEFAGRARPSEGRRDADLGSSRHARHRLPQRTDRPLIRRQDATVSSVDLPTIRPATPKDVPALSELAKRTWADAFGEPLDADDLAAELDRSRSEAYFINALKETTILVAEHDGALLGYVQFGDVKIPEVQARPGDLGLRRLYVDAAVQRRGLGRRLMNAALAHPRLATASRIFLTVWEKNTPALHLYERFGFKTVGTTRVTVAEKEVGEDLVMVLDKAAMRERATPARGGR
jgi:diamine N-acetyltransferase